NVNHVTRMDPRPDGAPERIRTSDPQIRSLVLYPAELRAREPPNGGADEASPTADAAYLAAEGGKSKRSCEFSSARRKPVPKAAWQRLSPEIAAACSGGSRRRSGCFGGLLHFAAS